MMTSVERFIGGFALLTYRGWQLAVTGYWRLPRMFFPERDIFGEAHYRHLDQIKQWLFSTWTVPIVVTAVALWFTPWRSWGAIDPHALLRPVILTASGIVTWRAISMNVDLATGKGHLPQRVLMVLAWVGGWLHPAFLIVLLHIGITWLRSLYHHQHLAIRSMLMFLACLGALPVLDFAHHWLPAPETLDLTVPVLFLWLTVSASHYFNPGMKKLHLGPHWDSWMRDNPNRAWIHRGTVRPKALYRAVDHVHRLPVAGRGAERNRLLAVHDGPIAEKEIMNSAGLLPSRLLDRVLG
jgi:hypothetical protein